MSDTIFIVKATVCVDYEGSDESNLLVTFDREEAISFAQEYHDKNEVSARILRWYDVLNVSVYSMQVGVAGTETRIFSTYKHMTEEVNTSLPLDFTQDEIRKDIENLSNPSFPMIVFAVNPTIGDLMGEGDIEATPSQDMFNSFASMIEKHLQSVYSQSVEQGLKPYELESSNEIESADDSHDWQLFNQFERQYFH